MPSIDFTVWPAELQSGGAGVFNVLTAPSNGMSHYLTGVLGSTASHTFKILRRSYAVVAAAATWTLGDHADIQLLSTEDFLFAFWIKLASGGKSATIFSKDNADADRYRFTTTSAGLPLFFIEDSNSDDCTVTGTTNICDGQWHFICIGGDRSVEQGLTMYVNGVAEATNAANDKLTEVGDAGSAENLVWTAPTGNMSLSTFALYTSTAFAAAAQAIEVTRLYNGGMGRLIEGTETSLTLGINNTDHEGTVPLDIKGSVTATYSAATFVVGGVPFVKDNKEAMPTLLDIVSNYQGIFPHPIKIGAGAALQIETSDDDNYLFFGYTDSRN